VGAQTVLDYRTISVALVAAFAFVGALHGGARTIVAVAVSLAVIVGLGEPLVADAALRLGEKVAAVLRRAVGAAAPGAVSSPGLYFFGLYAFALVAAILLSRVLGQRPVSRSSRVFGAVLGVLNGLLFTLMVKDYLLGSVGQALGGSWVIQVRLQPEVGALSVSNGGSVSVGTVAYVFGLLLAGAGLLRRLNVLKRPSL
jgi:hypothetical protein